MLVNIAVTPRTTSVTVNEYESVIESSFDDAATSAKVASPIAVVRRIETVTMSCSPAFSESKSGDIVTSNPSVEGERENEN